MDAEVADFDALDASADADAVIARVEAAGIVGMGGVGSSAAQKLRQARTLDVRVAIGNGMASEPEATADTTLLREHFAAVAAGLEIVGRCLDGARLALAVPPDSDLPPPAVAVDIPFGGDERRLAAHLTNQEASSGARPSDCGAVVFNVATLFAIHEAVAHGRKPRRRLVTVGNADQWLALGTPLAHLPIAERGALRVNGPLTGRPAAANAVVEATTFSIGLERPAALPCIRCGWCVPACPESLVPLELHDAFDADEEDSAALRCIECGACTAACPSGIDLVNEFRALKDRRRYREALRRRADEARARSDARAERLARQARQERERRAARLRSTQRW